ncbi:MAG: prolyl oligopeptidase family serine peptidase [Janthinobacterium lividum]
MTHTKTIAPFGTWESPVSVEQVAGQTVGLGSLAADGDALLWLELRPGEKGRTVLVRRGADGGVEDLTPAPFDVASRVHEYGGGAFVAQGGRVVFSNKADGSVWAIEPGGAPRVVSRVAGCRFADFAPVPGGRWVVCVREDHRGAGEAEAALVALDVGEGVDAEAQDGVVLVRGADFVSSPRPSPDGTRLAWIEWDHPDMPWEAARLCVAPLGFADGGEPGVGEVARPLGDGREAAVQPGWSPEGVLHVCSDRSGWWNLYRVGEAGVEAVCPMAAEVGAPHWVFGQASYRFVGEEAPGGTGIVASVISGGSARAVRIADGVAVPLRVDGTAADVRVGACPWPVAGRWAWLRAERDRPSAVMLGAEVVRASGAPALGEGDVSLAEAVTFPVEGGAVAHALFYAPANARFAGPDGERPPLIVVSHGGPTSMSTDAFSIRVQWWTSRGFAVADVNYGGSTGFGRAYRQRLDGQWGVVDVGDCVAAARHLAAEGRVDGARMAIRGGSAGGFTTLAALVGSDVFRAGASHYGVADLRLLAGDTHKFESRYLDGLIGKLPEDGAVYDARSPISHVERLSCPVIFFQGLDDKVVPPNQARAMAAAMRARGVAAALYEFAGEAHGFRQAGTIRRVLELELDFFGQVFGFVPAGRMERADVRV